MSEGTEKWSEPSPLKFRGKKPCLNALLRGVGEFILSRVKKQVILFHVDQHLAVRLKADDVRAEGGVQDEGGGLFAVVDEQLPAQVMSL